LLDIGGDIGALIVRMPAQLEGSEIEIRPVWETEVRPRTHVGVVARPAQHGPVPSLVFPELPAGEYELYVRPAEPVALTVSVTGGEVAEAVWPSIAEAG
jgi:hypothetical protein